VPTVGVDTYSEGDEENWQLRKADGDGHRRQRTENTVETCAKSPI